MKIIPASISTALLFILSCVTAQAASAQNPEPVGEEIAQTPADLATLLGPDGLDAAEFDFYLHSQVEGPSIAEGGLGIEDSVMHWRTNVENGRLVFTIEVSDLKGGGNISREVFSADGEYVESRSTSLAPGYQSTETAVLEGDKIHVTRGYVLEGDPVETGEDLCDLISMDGMIPTAWLPFAFAYHIREGNEVYQIHTFEGFFGDSISVQIFSIEDIGTEMVEVNGAEKEAHVLQISISAKMGGEPLEDEMEEGFSMRMLVLSDGTMVGTNMEMAGTVAIAHPITAEEAEALIADGIDDDDAE